MLELMSKVWAKEEVVQDWKDAKIVLIPKKDYLHFCDYCVAKASMML